MNARIIINFAAFQIAWFACVFLTRSGRPLEGALAPLGAVVLHLAIARARFARECAVIACGAAVGLALDGGALALGFLKLPGDAGLPVTLVWFGALWAGFSTMLGGSLGWMWRRPWLSALCGAVAGPLSYAGGARLGALVCERSPWCYVWLGVEWAVATPLLLTLAARLLGGEPRGAR